MYPSPLCLSRAFFLTSTTSQMKVSNKQPTRFIFTSLLQCWRCSHLSRCEGARSPHFLDCDAPGSAAVRPGFCAGRTGGAGCASTVVSDRTAMPSSADRHKKTTSRPTQDTLRGSAPPRAVGPVGTALPSASTSGLARRAPPHE